MEYTKIVDDIPEEGDIVEFKTWNGEICVGFYTLPYRAYPNVSLTNSSLLCDVK